MSAVYFGKDILDVNSFIYYINYTGRKISQKQYWISVITAVVKRCMEETNLYIMKELQIAAPDSFDVFKRHQIDT